MKLVLMQFTFGGAITILAIKCGRITKNEFSNNLALKCQFP